MDPQTSGLVNDFGRSTVGENCVNHDQVIEKNIADKIKREVDEVVMAVENPMRDAFLKAMDNVVILKVAMAERSILNTESSVPNPDQ